MKQNVRAPLYRLAQTQTLFDYLESGRLDDLPLDENGKIKPTDDAIRKAQEAYNLLVSDD